jgi:hypothetical protein
MCVGIMFSFLYFAYDNILDYLVKDSGEYDVIASPGLGLLLLDLALYGTLSGYILILAIPTMLVTLPKRSFTGNKLLTFEI